jgi:hypothetical protein
MKTNARSIEIKNKGRKKHEIKMAIHNINI